VVLDLKMTTDAFDIKISGDIRKFYFKPQYEKRMYELLRTHLWSLFNKLAMDKEFCPLLKPGRSMEVFKPKKEEHRIDKKTYKIAKPDIEHIEIDNMNDDDITSDDSSDDELTKEEQYKSI